ncbi:MAG TPA: TIGR01777 family oxidoreductase, partial [Bdellovibrio sp.]|nr:TIGR01777 family oxidoreductase [Bdellovibrio sp.]
IIGKEIGKVLAGRGHELVVITRCETKAREILPFPAEILELDLVNNFAVESAIAALKDTSAGVATHSDYFKYKQLKSIDAVINLMGEPVVGPRWTENLKQKIYDSRVKGTRNLVALLPSTLKAFISGSAIGYYGNCNDEVCFEDRKAGSDFLAQLTLDWEKEAAKAPGRKCFVRTGLVLSRDGGALKQMLFPFKAGVGGILGDGSQWMSWIHIKDIVELFVWALEKNIEGPLNGVAPSPVTNKDFSKALATHLGKSLGPPVPKAALRSIYGEAADTISSSIRASAEKVESLGYSFHFTDLDEALKDVCSPWKNGEEFFYTEQFVPLPPEKLFPFFKEPHNLERITPPTLHFQVLGISTPELEQGTLIDYHLKIHGLPAKWQTEIDEWQPPYKFVDNQRRGPYRMWHHTHEFRPFCGGTLMVDQVRYRLPLGYVGWLLGSSFVNKDVKEIFRFRRQYISRMTTEDRKS